MTLVIQGKSLYSVLDNKSRPEQTPFSGLTIPTAFESLLLLHVLSVVSSQAKQRAMKLNMSYKSGNRVRLKVQSVRGAWCKLFQKGGLPPVLKYPA